jgi:hypothetical protein
MAIPIWSGNLRLSPCPRPRKTLSGDLDRRPDCQAKADASDVKLAADLIEQDSGKFQPKKTPNEDARAVHELVEAKIEQRAPEVELEDHEGRSPQPASADTAYPGAATYLSASAGTLAHPRTGIGGAHGSATQRY